MGRRSRLGAGADGGLWLGHVPNPFNLAAPSSTFQRALIQYDKMLRLFPSQKAPVYRLVRLCRREARLGLNAMVVHDHPDTRVCIQEGVLPIAELHGWALQSHERVLRDLRARDTWRHGGCDTDPEKAIDRVIETMDAPEKAKEAARQADADGDFDERASRSYRWLRYGAPAWAYVQKPRDLFEAIEPLPAFPRTVDPPTLAPNP